MTTPDEAAVTRTGHFSDVERQHGRTADIGGPTMPGLVVEPERLPDGRSITYFSAGDPAQRSSTGFGREDQDV
ncbi:hypothetical protein [Actinomycetospora termitidis]|uniref:Uncharacterized protein n=1 Tax=Actinomycetospora termitidis TaxID=3053470 RepID=A0ABT7M5G2_9PSEU|nr:hypothetical protein [Actinomycetospora sp. Odt1-22]MDL5155896.1 hypothetical protein [Actinomycetospora sp. Odt1-22]